MQLRRRTCGGGCRKWCPIILMMTVFLTFLASGKDVAEGVLVGRELRPALAGGQRTDITTVLGSAAELRCQVLNQGTHIVSWVRVRDARVLAHDGEVFTADERVSTGSDGDGHWLRLTGVRSSDAGRYECQLNTDPKTSLRYTINVVSFIPSTVPPLPPPSAPTPERMAGDQPARDSAVTQAGTVLSLLILLVMGTLM